jgi:iron complex outermembrane receptor protein
LIRNGVISSVLLVSVALGIELNTINVQSSKVYETEVEALQSVHIIDEKEMQTFSIDDITDMSALLPNINISGIGNRMDRTFTFRGVSNYTTLESSIALYVDDVPIPFSYGLGSVDMENVSHIEVVKGPQGTLFGKGAESGVINIYTKQPTDTFGNSVKLGVGEYNTKEFYMRSSGPINDQTKFSLAVTKNLTDGYSKNVFMDSHFDHKDRLGVSAKVHHTIDDSSTIAFNYTYSKLDDGGSPLKLDTKENPHKIENQKSNDYAKIDHNLFSLIYKKTYDNMELTSTTTFAKEVMDRHIYINILGGFTMDFDVDIQEFTQEFRVKQRFDNVEWIHGLFYSDKTRFNYKENQTLTTSGLTSLNDLTNPDKNYALFTKFKYIYSDQIIYTAGIRYQKNQ